MTKYFLTFVLLTCLALENNSICSRAHPSRHEAESIDVHQMRQHKQYQQLQQAHHAKPHYAQMQQAPLQQQRHETHARHQRTRRSKLQESETAEEDDANSRQRYYARLRRHLQQQREHLERQERSYHHTDNNNNNRTQAQSDAFKSMPRIWQHLFNVNYDEVGLIPDDDYLDYEVDEDAVNRMLGDDPKIYAEPSVPPAPTAAPVDAPVVLPTLALTKHADNEDEAINSIAHELPPLAESSIEENVKTLERHEDETVSKPAVAKPGCPKCEHNRQTEHISEEELTRLRIEYVKLQILEKLRLKERPNVSAVGLPKPIYEGVTIEQPDDSAKNKEIDDYYARTSKKFIFLKREKRECRRLGAHPSMCFSFKIDDIDADGFDVSSAVLWLFKNKQNLTNSSNVDAAEQQQQTIVVSEVQQQLDAKYLPMAKTIAIQTIDVQDEWMKINIEWPIKRWFGNHDLSHLIQISCESCDINSIDEMISVDKDYRPFIMIDTQNRRRHPRQKRSINCANGVTECCREKLYISFDEIGWGDWIIQPRGYDAYFCRGSCGSVASVTQSSSHHSTFLAKVLSSHSGGQKPLELIPCCTAKQYSSLQLVFLDSNNTATQKTFPNMVVESCGCR